MRRILLFVLLSFFTCNIHAQKKKVVKKTPPAKAIVIAKNETNNIQVEYLNKLITVYYTNNTVKDTLFTAHTLENISADNFTIKEFKNGSKNLILFSWNEVITKNTDILKENMFISENQIWDFENKKRLVSNSQKKGSSEKIHYLSKHKDASETIYSKVSNGRSFLLLPNGDYSLSSEKGTDKFAYNTANNEYKVVLKNNNSKRQTTNRRR